ncbi:D-glycero-alpha-D-manno-heptose-7-phosphate kinase [Hydrobacter penzbergensis]|uniref:D-glycero-alpha-D-manno-heptose-7-phosphate kinase n=1 Tax=Hydrobacter penzbergensis TaxID=1235997 RepID=A0A8X8LAR0_9BACT|nr:dehydrogenase [Hydrobacter penzbergensis]SDW53246.1 D-glycero-alpha-D-manno-heptose-7-phosphate kinase [Hydrobacter penzbergensis]
MIYRSKAPLRIGLAGGGTDVSPYSDLYGGAILNATVSLYASASIEPIKQNGIIITSVDQQQEQYFEWGKRLPIDGKLDLLKGVYNRIQYDFGFPKTSFRLSTHVDAPAGSGLGTSSTLVVAIIGAFAEMLRLPLGEYDIANYAYDIERNDLRMAGGKQDQYAATFGGVNFMEFYADNKVIVNPLRVKEQYLFELENNLLLYHISARRGSAKIIERQSSNVANKKEQPILAMHQLKEQALMMKEALLTGNIHEIGNILDYGFLQKKKIAEGISNERIDEVYQAAKRSGATGGKISGAGGGGFMTFYCPANTKHQVMKTLEKFGAGIKRYQFVEHGLKTWAI